METVVVHEESELGALASSVLAALPTGEAASVIGLTGDLGAGKTAFTKALAKTLGIEEHVTSPTFVIMKSYPVSRHERFKTLTHIDAYRIEEADELRVLAFHTILEDPHRLVVIEWPERIGHTLPADMMHLSMSIGEGGVRTVTYGE